MHSSHPSAPVAAAAMSVIPAPLLARLVSLMMRSMRRRHPKLFDNFGKLDPAVIHVEATDLPHRIAIDYGRGRMEVRVLLDERGPPPDAKVKASLMTLVDLLEGRIDGDSMFFTRGLEVTGSTTVIVAVRNTLDREEVDIRDEIAAAFGPFEKPARRIGRAIEHGVARARARLVEFHAGLHAEQAGQRDLAAECDALRAEVKALKLRIAKLDVRQSKRADAAATGAP